MRTVLAGRPLLEGVAVVVTTQQWPGHTESFAEAAPRPLSGSQGSALSPGGSASESRPQPSVGHASHPGSQAGSPWSVAAQLCYI